ncbi:MAG: SUMF1/EgtB/PvdO family nonheme iron enzyme [Elusimicrobia bacterium]|nr:SUMF1/EgtB/PvdO family nonheme iron enzyme [Elusimicrobiota bacterium]
MKARHIAVAVIISALMSPAGYCAGPQKKSAHKPAQQVEWVSIPGGRFTMGTNDFYDAKPAHTVTIETFQMSKTPVTVGQYAKCVVKGRCTAPDALSDCNWGKTGRQNHPINCVDWDQADRYAKFMDARLPSEAEWEYAATSGGREQKYPWGNEAPASDLAVIDTSGTMAVCSKPKGNTAQGLCDMSGNVEQWVQDVYKDSYDDAPVNGGAYEGACSVRGGEGTCNARIIRGGAFSIVDFRLRADNRDTAGPDSRRADIGFRLAR